MIKLKKLTSAFYARKATIVAKELIGKYLVHEQNGEKFIGMITETEAYMGPDDKAAHSYNNHRSKRNEAMYGPAGHAYIYIIYGIHICFNIVTATINIPQGVLIRGVEPIEGIRKMALNRYKTNLEDLTQAKIHNLTNGSGKLTQAMGITMNDYGINLQGNKIYLLDSKKKHNIKTSPRININYAGEAIHYPWRFYIKDNPYVSKPNR